MDDAAAQAAHAARVKKLAAFVHAAVLAGSRRPGTDVADIHVPDLLDALCIVAAGFTLRASPGITPKQVRERGDEMRKAFQQRLSDLRQEAAEGASHEILSS
jgi:hypothetical protein